MSEERRAKWRQIVRALQTLGYIDQRYSGTVSLRFKDNGDLTVELSYRKTGHEQIQVMVKPELLPAQFVGRVSLHMRHGGLMDVSREERELGS